LAQSVDVDDVDDVVEVLVDDESLVDAAELDVPPFDEPELEPESEPALDPELDEDSPDEDSPDEDSPDDDSPAEPDGTVDDDLPRLSFLKKPLPLNVTPTGWNTFFTAITSPDSG